MNKGEIIAWLNLNNVEFNPSATLRQLRLLAIAHGYTTIKFLGDSESASSTLNSSANSEMDENTIVENKLVEATPSTTSNQNADRLLEIEAEKTVINAEIELFQLKSALMELRQSSGKPSVEFSDIVHAIVLYPGSDAYDAKKWIADFEQICDSVNGDDVFKLKSVRRLMKPNCEAEIFLRIDQSTNYADFKQHFLQTFSQPFSVLDVLNLLKTTMFIPQKMSVLGYILQMQEIAARAPIGEEEIVQVIIEGLRDESPDIAILYPAKTIDGLKQLARRYVKLRQARRGAAACDAAKKKPIATNMLRCYNCSAYGHMSSACTAPKRLKGSCFQCGSTQHLIKDCKVKSSVPNKSIALADDPNQLEFERANTVPEV